MISSAGAPPGAGPLQASTDALLVQGGDARLALDPIDAQPGRPVFNRTITLKDTWAKAAL